MVTFIDEMDDDIVPFGILHTRLDGSVIIISRYSINPFWPFWVHLELAKFGSSVQYVNLRLRVRYFVRGLPWRSALLPLTL